MPSPTFRSFRTALVFSSVLPLLGCPGDDGGTDTNAADSTTTDTTNATTTTDPDGTTTTATTATTADPTDTTSTTDAPTTSATGTGTDSGTDESGSSTGEMEVCEVMLPPPGKCGAADLPGPVYLPANWPGTSNGAAVIDDYVEEDDPEAGGGTFIMEPDGGGIVIECNVFTQDCPDGEKCMPWANDGGSSWNATRCSPIAAAPNQVGDTCSVEGSGVSGVDDCDISMMCWDVDGETNEGTCVEMCGCSEATPICNTMNTTCAVSNDGVLALCLPVCNPVDPDSCGAGLGCYPTGDTFFCAPDVSGAVGEAGDSCEFINACSAGLICLGAANVPDCASTVGCCSAACTIGDDTACLAGQTCTPWYNPGDAPDECLGMAGVCTL